MNRFQRAQQITSNYLNTSGIRRVFSELMGGAQRIVTRVYRMSVPWANRRDVGTPDYAFADALRHGKKHGLELAGLLVKPMESKIASWVMGSAPTFNLTNQVAQQDLTRWWRRNHPKILQAYQKGEGVGDNYLIVNADLSLTVVPANVVSPIVDDNDYSKVIGWEVAQRFPHPTKMGEEQTIIDRYTAMERVRIVQVGGITVSTKRFRNVIGKIPVIHIKCNAEDDEMFGRPIWEALLSLLYQYNETLVAALDGNRRQGRPTPVFKKLGNQEQVNSFTQGLTQVEVDSEGNRKEYIEFDADQAVFLPGDAEFDWKSPGLFANDTEKLLGLLFYLYLQHSEMPEFVLGNAISSSKASAETQLPIFIQFVEKKRGEAEEWVRQLAEVVLAYIGVVDMTARGVEDLEIEWDDLTNEDGTLTLKAIDLAVKNGWITRETALSRMPALKVKDPAAEIKAADAEREELRQKEEERMESAVDRAIRDAEARAAALDADDQDEETEDEEEREVA